MRKLNLGDKVKVNKYYQRNGNKPQGHNAKRLDRYIIREIDKDGVWCGKRNICTKGYLQWDDYERQFITVETVRVNLVAIAINRLVYVPDDGLEVQG